jgi:hypothetical protein
MPVRVVVERGPKGKKAVAFAVDWPGWSRGAKTPELAVDLLEQYRPRYRPVAEGSGLGSRFSRAGKLDVVEDRVGTSSTDFWAISFSPCDLEVEPMAKAELDRKLDLLVAAWARFDEVAATVSDELRKGPRGGGRDRHTIWRHVIRNESEELAKRVGLRIPEEGALTADGLRAFRSSYVAAIRAYNAGELPRMRSWNLPFLIRHTAFHVLDHTWEMEDKDLTAA